jgi:hypothetical protein
MAEAGRLPHLGDEVPPWAYRGWMLPYVVALHERIPSTGNRWGYHLDQLAAGHVNSAIPQVSFSSPSSEVRRMLGKLTDELYSRHRLYAGPHLALTGWLGHALACCERERAGLDEGAEEFLYRTFNADLLLLHPYDYLGDLFVEARGAGKSLDGFYPTPPAMCQLMIGMIINPSAPVTGRVYDPCVGTGRFLLAASNHCLNLFGQDINPWCTLATKINGALFAPWLFRPLPAEMLGDEGGEPILVERTPPGDAPLQASLFSPTETGG